MHRSEKIAVILAIAWFIASLPLSDFLYREHFDGILMRVFTLILATFPVGLIYAWKWVTGSFKANLSWLLLASGAYAAVGFLCGINNIFSPELPIVIISGGFALFVLGLAFQPRNWLKRNHLSTSESKDFNKSIDRSLTYLANPIKKTPFSDLPKPEDVKAIAKDLTNLTIYGMSRMNDMLRRVCPRSPAPQLIIHDADALKIAYTLLVIHLERFAYQQGGKKFILAFAMTKSRLLTILLKVMQPRFPGIPEMTEDEIEQSKELRASGTGILELQEKAARQAIKSIKEQKDVPLVSVLGVVKPYFGKEFDIVQVIDEVGDEVDELNVFFETEIAKLVKKYAFLDRPSGGQN